MANVSFISVSKLIQLLSKVDTQRDMHLRVLSANRLLLGNDPFHPTHSIDLNAEVISAYDSDEKAGGNVKVNLPTSTTESGPLGAKFARSSGQYWYEIKGQRTQCRSLKELLREGLRALERSVPGTLEKLSQLKPRSRRIVARDPRQLFDREHLVTDYAEQLVDGWWFGTNNSSHETNLWLSRACAFADLEWGTEFTTSLPGQRVASKEELLAM